MTSIEGPPALGLRFLQSILGALTGATVASVAWALATSGDFFAVGAAHLFTIAIAAGVGAHASDRIRRWPARGALIAVAALSLLYWIAAPSGWWATPPPSPSSPRSP